MLFRILGPLRVHETSAMGSPVRRAILTAFLLRPGRSIGIGELLELLWDEPPASATANIRSHIAGLRRDLEDIAPGLSDRLKTYRGSQSSYGLDVTSAEFDLAKFTRSARDGRSLLLSGDADAAADALEEATALWRGPFGLDLPPTRWFTGHVAGLNSARIDAYQDLFTACILANRTEMLCYRIERVIVEEPYRQSLWELLAAAHCVCGDAVGSLNAIKRCQTLFADDLGLGLPPTVEAMRSAALNWDSARALRLIEARASASDSGQRYRAAPKSLALS
ncbi:BTAD domain-containing putative transcriptional regulator [Streptomyces sp. NPDC005790]|uniref:AfsR/SARP family transcriptional regulator n=1 Tax=Streptomyces sp. NPDC005790 TaxID=3154777 RepID=UPI0033E2B2C2